jgi:oxygen-independent coproporphyrinogen III oxidase
MTRNAANPPQTEDCGSVQQARNGADDPFLGYCYSYPHKTAHRPLSPPVPLDSVWRSEDRSRLSLYFHVPFCASRCGFCNLFTLDAPNADLIGQYLAQVHAQALAVGEALGDLCVARLAIGGGTPTLLSTSQLDALLDIATGALGVALPGIPASCEVSPATITREKLELLKHRGVTRLSIGVQTFDADESARLGRRQSAIQALGAIEAARHVGFPTINVDLIYGIPEQTVGGWIRSVRRAIGLQPEELYLYPLYIRPLTALGATGVLPSQDRLTAYRESRELLLASGYRQVSLRMFRCGSASEVPGPVYCCQSDGMIGLGCGARSYTRRLHYGSRYAVGRPDVERILREFLALRVTDLARAGHGIWLDDEEQRRRFLILTLLYSGCDRREYRDRFGSDVVDDFPCLLEFENHGSLIVSPQTVRLTSAGVERSDVIGPALFSEKVRHRMEEHRCR